MKKLIPTILKKLDNYLVINHPSIWSLRIHYILPACVIFIILSIAFGYSVKLRGFDFFGDQETVDPELYFVAFLSISAGLALFWIFHISRIKKTLVFRDGLSNWHYIFLYAFVLVLLITPAFTVAYILEYRLDVAQLYTDSQDYRSSEVPFIFTLIIGEIITLIMLYKQLPAITVTVNVIIFIAGLFLFIFIENFIYFNSESYAIFTASLWAICSVISLITLLAKESTRWRYFFLVTGMILTVPLPVILLSSFSSINETDEELIIITAIFFIGASLAYQPIINRLHSLPVK